MRIAFLVDRFPALSETFILNQITGLIDRGHDVEIVAKAPRNEAHHPDVARYQLIKQTTYWPTIPDSRVARWLKGVGQFGGLLVRQPSVAFGAANVPAYGRHALTLNLAYAATALGSPRRFDVVHAHFGDNGLLAIALREMGLLDGRVATSFHGFDMSMAVRTRGANLYARLFRTGDAFLPVSDRWKARLLGMGCPPERTVVHRMGIDCRLFNIHPHLPSGSGEVRLISVARLVEKKGLEYSIRAVARLAASGKRIQYTIIGAGPLRDALELLVNTLGLQNIVDLRGNVAQPEVIRALQAAHLFVAPSVVASDGDEEGIPVVLMEAMAMGLPIVATQHSGIPELVEDNISGRLVPERDVNALAQAIGELTDHRELWPGMGEAGRRRVLALHDIDKLNDSLVELYRRVAA